MKRTFIVLAALLAMGGGAILIEWWRSPRIGHVLDEALLANVQPEALKAADEDYFHDMDGGVQLSPDEIKGRNTWIVWSAGNDRFWNTISLISFNTLDFLKTVSSHPKLAASRDNRWEYLGLVNEPCYVKATGPDPKRYGLWLDQRQPDCPPDPFENEQKYPGVQIGARGKNIPAGSYFGYATGIVGLRLFPNPDFDTDAEKKWDAVRYYNDPSYYESKDLIKPYRVGMACGFCHVGPNPVRAPADPNHPKWENLSSNVGAQYFRVDRIFSWKAEPQNFIYQLFHTSRPGSLDTSFIATDSINNPRNMNALYLLGPRLAQAKRWGKETLAGGGLNNKQFNDFVSSGVLTQFFEKPATAWAPKVLKDGADSVGALGALNRVYVNIGEFSEEWLLHFNPLAGGKTVSPIEISVARRNSSYFAATESQTPAVAAFFLKTTGAHHLSDAADHAGDKYLTADKAVLTRGKVVYAQACARCHSSKLPESAPGLDPNGCSGKDYMSCWNKYWEWTKTAEFKNKMLDIVLADDFLKDNYLATEFRVPVTVLNTNACSPLATNATAGNIWDNFSSQSYKDLPSVGEITWYHPLTGEPRKYLMPAGGRGYTRPPSLVSVWATAPFLLNNTVGSFEIDPSVDGRMRSFESSIEELLWPERRAKDSKLGDKVPGMMDRTSARSYLRVSRSYLPDMLQPFYSLGQKFVPWIFGAGGLEIGPIPIGTPIGLLADLDTLSPDKVQLVELVLGLNDDLKKLGKDATDEQAAQVFRKRVDQLLDLSKCKDLVVNRGHYFGTDYLEPGEQKDAAVKARALSDRGPALSDEDKRALIEFLKTF